MTKRKKWMIVGAVAVVALLGLWSVIGDSGVPVDVVVVRRGSMSVSVVEEGRTRVREAFIVAAPVTGRLSRTDVEEGDRVEPGQTLATLAPPPQDPRVQAAARADVAAAEARLRQATAGAVEAEGQYGQAAREVERRRPLFDQGALSVETMERFEQAADAALARLRSAEAAVRSAQADLDASRARMLGADPDGGGGSTVQVRAPAAGTVLRVLQESERVVQAGTPLFELGDAEGLEVVIDVLTADAVAVRPGQPVRVDDWGGDVVLNGTVRYVEPQAFTEVSALGVEEQRVNVIADLDRTPPGLGAGYRVEAGIVTWRGTDVLSVPTSALFRRGGAWHLFVVEGGRARLRPVEMGHRGGERAEVRSGLVEGEAVVLFPSDLVGEGVEVTPRQDSDDGGSGGEGSGGEDAAGA